MHISMAVSLVASPYVHKILEDIFVTSHKLQPVLLYPTQCLLDTLLKSLANGSRLLNRRPVFKTRGGRLKSPCIHAVYMYTCSPHAHVRCRCGCVHVTLHSMGEPELIGCPNTWECVATASTNSLNHLNPLTAHTLCIWDTSGVTNRAKR